MSISGTTAVTKKPRQGIWCMNLGVWCIAKKQNKDGKQEAVLQVKKKKKKALGKKTHVDTSLHFKASHRAALTFRVKISCRFMGKGNKELFQLLPQGHPIQPPPLQLIPWALRSAQVFSPPPARQSFFLLYLSHFQDFLVDEKVFRVIS